MHNIVVQHFCISIAPVRSRGGLLVENIVWPFNLWIKRYRVLEAVVTNN
jgi:hypothetical protein